MNRLNGWQRIWFVLMVVWAVPVAFLFIKNPPRYDGRGWYGQPYSGVSKHMPTRAWWGSECVGRELESGERIFRDNGIQGWTGERWQVIVPAFDPKEFAGFTPDPTPTKSPDQMPDLKRPNDDWVTVPNGEYIRAKVNSDAHIALCFDTRIADAEMNRILAEYATVYRSAWWRAVADHVGIGLLLWLIPGAALYALGWGIGWIRRGFQN